MTVITSVNMEYLKVAKKSSSGIPYAPPKVKPTYSFVKDDVDIKVYYNSYEVEVYQTANKHTQRVALSFNQYENFENILKQNGFKPALV